MINFMNRPHTRNQILAQRLLDDAQDFSPIQSPMQGIARLGAGIAAGYKQQKDDLDYSKTMQNAMNVGTNQPAGKDPSTGITWNQPRAGDPDAAMAVLRSNPDTAGFATQMQLNKIASPGFSLGKGSSMGPPVPVRFNS